MLVITLDNQMVILVVPIPSHDGSMVLLYMGTWIPSIYPSHVSINILYTIGNVYHGTIGNIDGK